MYYVYILQNTNGRSYVGFTRDLKTRLKSHKEKTVKTTKDSKHQLIFYCAFKDKQKALDFEKYLKHGSWYAFVRKHFL